MLKKAAKNLLVVALILVLAIALAACGDDSPEAAAIGRYEATTIEMGGESADISTIYSGETYIELAKDGEGTISVDGTPVAITWALDGSNINVDMEGSTSSGTLNNDTLVLEIMDIGMQITFVK